MICYVKVEVDTTGNDYGNRVSKSSDPEVEDDDFSRGLLNFKSCSAGYERAFPKLSQEKAQALHEESKLYRPCPSPGGKIS